MKLRIRGDSIRLRLGLSEVSQMLSSGIVPESTTFDPARGQRLEYAVVSARDCNAVSAAFENGRVLVSVPHDLVAAWGTTEQVGISGTQVNSDGGMLRVLIEKDFGNTSTHRPKSRKKTLFLDRNMVLRAHPQASPQRSPATNTAESPQKAK